MSPRLVSGVLLTCEVSVKLVGCENVSSVGIIVVLSGSACSPMVFDIDRARRGDRLDIEGSEGRRQRRFAECRLARRVKEAAMIDLVGFPRNEELDSVVALSRRRFWASMARFECDKVVHLSTAWKLMTRWVVNSRSIRLPAGQASPQPRIRKSMCTRGDAALSSHDQGLSWVNPAI